ncbi:thymidylate kinase [Monosporozyma unispora]|nr:Thymidylate kinase [Kazachstania unispora]
MARGQLILVEGLDRTGKTTQTELLINRLKPNVELIKFPKRDTPIGKIINEYLTNANYVLPDQSVHLLFSANRWEVKDQITKLLNEGKNVILDRYVYSGVAYSAAKETPGMNWQWCFAPDKGLLRPDLTLFLTHSDSRGQAQRDGFGEERYEVGSFQDKVKSQFETLFDKIGNPEEVKLLEVTGKSIEEVGAMVWNQVQTRLNCPNDEFKYF